MKKLLLLTAMSVFANTALADDYSFWVVDTKKTKLSLGASASALKAQLSGENLLPCIVPTDTNATGIKCGDLYFAAGGFYTSTSNNFLSSVKLPKAMKGYKQTSLGNFKSPTLGVAGDSIGHQSAIVSDVRLKEIHFQVSAGQPLAPSSDTLYVTVNGVEREFPLSADQANDISVSDPKGFTQVLVRSTGATDAFVADYFGYTPK